LFKLNQLSTFLSYAFETGLVQPFKQIFRELYTLTDDEKEAKYKSHRYAGNQIQPKKAVSLLKSRGWTTDYYEGLQKIFHKENIVVTMHAMADWYMPSELEAPTIEYTRFYHRKTGENIDMKDIPPVLFSEIMRDIDLVVSVAHVGGVDPETSSSTIELRGVIVKESVRLMKLTNVVVEERFVKIKGKYGDYTVHLGSGQAHMMGQGALGILPVHSQHRGKIFLPFLDEDPKTAEIVAKTLLLAEDEKIKDPSIM